jgi:hypothetical protein
VVVTVLQVRNVRMVVYHSHVAMPMCVSRRDRPIGMVVVVMIVVMRVFVFVLYRLMLVGV